MARVKFITAAEAAGLIPDAAVVCISSSSGLHCPDTILQAIGERFAQSGAPRDLIDAPPHRVRRHVRHRGH